MATVYNQDEIGDYELPEIAAPENFNPDVSGYVDPPVGKHDFVIAGFQIVPDHEFRIKGETYVLDQLRPQLRIEEGEFAGASIMDFLPLPTGPMHEILANRWGQFVKRCGFSLKPGQLRPDNFKLQQLIKRKVAALVQIKTDQNGQQAIQSNGQPRMEVAFFGYDYPNGTAPQQPTTKKPSTTTLPPKGDKNTKPESKADSAAGPGFQL